MFSTHKTKIILFLIILISSVISSITMFRSGLRYDFGIGFWGPNGHDAIWHISLINQLKQNIPPQNPVFSGNILSNYHWGFDLVVALISKITQINVSVLYFQILPFIFALILGILSYKFSFLISKNSLQSLLFVILNYFASSFGWIYTLVKTGQIGGESLFWSMQSASTLLNPPYALSLIILLLGLIIWYKHRDSSSIYWGLVVGLIFSLLSFIKVYSAILIGLSLSIYWLIILIKNKDFSKFNFTLCFSMGIFSVFILKMIGVFDNTSLLEFKPFWFTHSMIESLDKLYWPKLASFRYNQTNYFISIIIEIFLVLLFLVGNLGFRILGLIKISNSFFSKKINDFTLLSIPFLSLSFLFPLLFVQKGTAWNTIQFFYYFTFIVNFYFASFLSNIFNKLKFFTAILLLITCIGSLGTLKDYLGNPPPSNLPVSEIKALFFLKNQPFGYVLTYPYDKYIKKNMNTPIPLYAYETTSYVSAFSEKPTFLEDEMNLDITGFDWEKRRQDSIDFFNGDNKYFSRGLLVNNNISYIYLTNNQKINLSQLDLGIDKIYDQDGINIYKVQR